MCNFLAYTALGCAELNVPAGSWVRMEDDTAHVTCNNTEQTFSLVCEGSQWKGKITNCTKGKIFNNSCRVYFFYFLTVGEL